MNSILHILLLPLLVFMAIILNQYIMMHNNWKIQSAGLYN